MSNTQERAALEARLEESLRSGLLFGNAEEPLDAYGKRIVRVILAALKGEPCRWHTEVVAGCPWCEQPDALLKRAAKKAATKAAEKPGDTIHFSMEYQSGSGDDWTRRKASVHQHSSRGYVLYTTTVLDNHEPRYFADFGEAVVAAMAFAQGTE
jgi:hypothetical protein